MALPAIDEIQETVRLFPALSRWELGQTICEHLGWFTASGSYKTDACLTLLQQLEAKGRLRLPPKRAISPQGHAPIPLTPRTGPKAEIAGSVGEVAPAHTAPITEQMEPISSSICMNTPPTSLSRTAIRSMISLEGVMGYPP